MTADNDDSYINVASKRYQRVIEEWDKIPYPHSIHDNAEGAELFKDYQKIKKNYEKVLNCRDPNERTEYFDEYNNFIKRVQRYCGRIPEKADVAENAVIQTAPAVQLPVTLPSQPGDKDSIEVSTGHSTASTGREDSKPTEPPKPLPAPVAPPPPPRNELPRVNEPAIYFRLKSDSANGTPVELIKRMLDNAPSLLGNVGTALKIDIEIGIDKGPSIDTAEASPVLRDTLGIEVGFDKDHLFLTGTPRSGFDGMLAFSFAGQHPQQGGATHFKPFFIAPDPRSLWKNLPVADYEGYQNLNEALAGEPIPDINRDVLAASCRGRSHAHAATPRDDHFAFAVDSVSNWMFTAVADGAGSARYSRKGSQLACDTAIATLKTMLERPDIAQEIMDRESTLREWKKRFEEANGIPEEAWEAAFRSEFKFDAIFHNAVHSAYMAIHEESAKRNAGIKDYHTTLLVAAFRKFAFGFMFIFYWIGDGGIALIDWNRKGGVLVPGRPDGGEFAGQTRFLTMPEEITDEAIRKRVQVCFADDFAALVQMTDGVTDPFFPAENDVVSAGRWKTFWDVHLLEGSDGNVGCRELSDRTLPPADRAKALRKWLDFWSKGNHDDRTILIVQ